MVDIEELLSLKEASKLLPAVTPVTLRRWANTNKVAHIRMPNGRLWFEREAIQALMTPVVPEAGTDGVA